MVFRLGVRILGEAVGKNPPILPTVEQILAAVEIASAEGSFVPQDWKILRKSGKPICRRHRMTYTENRFWGESLTKCKRKEDDHLQNEFHFMHSLTFLPYSF
jgi:hypothetical protein